jgi:RecA/RadA recombinase
VARASRVSRKGRLSGQRNGGDSRRFLNQLRQKIGVPFGSPETTTGGNALKFYASMRFDVRRIGQIKVGDEPVGGRTHVNVAKNKCEPPFTAHAASPHTFPAPPG